MHKFIILPVFLLLTACSSTPGSQNIGKIIGGAMVLGGAASLPDKDETDEDGKKLGWGLIASGLVVGYISAQFEERRKAEIDKIEKQKRDVILAEKQRVAVIQRERDKLIQAQKEKERLALISTPLYKSKQKVLRRLVNLESDFKKLSQDNHAMLESSGGGQTECEKINTAYEDRLSAVIKLSDGVVHKILGILSDTKSKVHKAKDMATVNSINSDIPRWEKALIDLKEADKKSQLANAYLYSKDILKHQCHQ